MESRDIVGDSKFEEECRMADEREGLWKSEGIFMARGQACGVRDSWGARPFEEVPGMD